MQILDQLCRCCPATDLNRKILPILTTVSARPSMHGGDGQTGVGEVVTGFYQLVVEDENVAHSMRIIISKRKLPLKELSVQNRGFVEGLIDWNRKVRSHTTALSSRICTFSLQACHVTVGEQTKPSSIKSNTAQQKTRQVCSY